jgi:hypothetical protein
VVHDTPARRNSINASSASVATSSTSRILSALGNTFLIKAADAHHTRDCRCGAVREVAGL